jgi:GxxExxY protein
LRFQPSTKVSASKAACAMDILVRDSVIVELKSVRQLDPLFKAQILTYLRLTGLRLGFLINFNVPVIKAGIARIIL